MTIIFFLDDEMAIRETDDNLEGAVSGEIEHHTSQEQTDLESDSKGDLHNIINSKFSEVISAMPMRMKKSSNGGFMYSLTCRLHENI